MIRQLKKMILQSPIVLAAPMRTNLEKRPFTQTILSPQNFTMDTEQKVALGLLIVPTLFVFGSSLISGQWPLFFITGFMLMLFGFITWIIKLRAQMVWRVTWHHDLVEVEDGRYGKPEQWREPLSVFIGLQRDVGYRQRGGQYTLNRKVNGLLLAHSDPFKSILLHANIFPIEDETIAYYESMLNQKLID